MNIEFPGLFDLQVNGFGGVDFNAPDLTADSVSAALERMRAVGVTRALPTLITSSFEDFAASGASPNSSTLLTKFVEDPLRVIEWVGD